MSPTSCYLLKMGTDASVFRARAELPQKGDIVANGKYRIDRLIGQGGMGAVFVGVHTTLGTRVAIKWMLPKFTSDYTAVQRFLREATIAARIRHPNVVQPIDVSDDPTNPFIIMELLEGQSLAKYVGDRRLPPDEITRIFIPVLEAVGAAHQHKIIHRDLKLDNIFLTDAGSGGIVPKVLDFGIAKFTDKGTFATITQDHSVLGTVQYMSPEQILHPSDVTEQTDIYSLGVILFRLLTGTFPHRAENILDLALRIRDTPPTPLSKHFSNVPPGLESALARALARSVDQRFRDVKSFEKAVTPHLGRDQEWMKTLAVTGVNSLGPVSPTSIVIASSSTVEADNFIPSSLHSLELDSYRVPRRSKTLYFWAPLFVIVLALIGTLVWFKLQRQETRIYSNQLPTIRKPIDQRIKPSIPDTPTRLNHESKPQPKGSENEWPSLSQFEEEPDVPVKGKKASIRADSYKPIETPRVKVRKPQFSVQTNTVKHPPSFTPTTVEPKDRRKTTYEMNSGAENRTNASVRKSNQPDQPLPLSETKPPVSSEESSGIGTRVGELNLEDF